MLCYTFKLKNNKTTVNLFDYNRNYSRVNTVLVGVVTNLQDTYRAVLRSDAEMLLKLKTENNTFQCA